MATNTMATTKKKFQWLSPFLFHIGLSPDSFHIVVAQWRRQYHSCDNNICCQQAPHLFNIASRDGDDEQRGTISYAGAWYYYIASRHGNDLSYPITWWQRQQQQQRQQRTTIINDDALCTSALHVASRESNDESYLATTTTTTRSRQTGHVHCIKHRHNNQLQTST